MKVELRVEASETLVRVLAGGNVIAEITRTEGEANGPDGWWNQSGFYTGNMLSALRSALSSGAVSNLAALVKAAAEDELAEQRAERAKAATLSQVVDRMTAAVDKLVAALESKG